MLSWPRRPAIYEINTWVWLQELSQTYNQPFTLGNVPKQEWDAIASLGFDAVWLMGVWERSPASARIALENLELVAEFQRTLPDYSPIDVVGSPYSVRRYQVDGHLGGTEGLAIARCELDERGKRLILDFVPNHVAPDHPWVLEHPEYFIQGDSNDLVKSPGDFFKTGGNVFAYGRDPYFPPWQDVLQVNAFHPGLRQAGIETLNDIASQCDGVRCDMAMLLINQIFEKSWGGRAGARPEVEFWTELIQAVKEKHPGTLLIAEVYWDLEWELQQLGFDFCYDKRLYDRMQQEDAQSVRLHLLAEVSFQEKLLRFLENHDESRAAATFSPEKQYAAALAIASLPGAKLFHEGQLEGRAIKLSVFLGRRPAEQPNLEVQSFYRLLLRATNSPAFREGEWQLCERMGWPDNASYLNLLAWCLRHGDERWVVVINYSDYIAQGHVRLPWEDLPGRSWTMFDIVKQESYERNGDEIRDPGLYVDIEPRGFHFLKFE